MVLLLVLYVIEVKRKDKCIYIYNAQIVVSRGKNSEIFEKQIFLIGCVPDGDRREGRKAFQGM